MIVPPLIRILFYIPSSPGNGYYERFIINLKTFFFIAVIQGHYAAHHAAPSGTHNTDGSPIIL